MCPTSPTLKECIASCMNGSRDWIKCLTSASKFVKIFFILWSVIFSRWLHGTSNVMLYLKDIISHYPNMSLQLTMLKCDILYLELSEHVIFINYAKMWYFIPWSLPSILWNSLREFVGIFRPFNFVHSILLQFVFSDNRLENRTRQLMGVLIIQGIKWNRATAIRR